MNYLNYDASGFIVGINKMSEGIEGVHDDTQDIIKILQSQNQIANTRMAELSRAVRTATYRNNSQDRIDSSRSRASQAASRQSANNRLSSSTQTRSYRQATDDTLASRSSVRHNGSQSQSDRDQGIPISRDSTNAATRQRDANGRFSSGSNGAAGSASDRERDANGRFTGSSTTGSKSKGGYGSGSGAGSTNLSGVDPLIDTINEAKGLLSPINRGAKLLGRGAKFSWSKYKSMKRREPLPVDQDRHNNENEKLLDKIWKAIRKSGGNSGGGGGLGLLGSLLGGGRRGRGGRGGMIKNLLKKVGGIKGLSVLAGLAGTASLAMDWKGLDHKGKSEGVGGLAGMGVGGLIGGAVGAIGGPVGIAVGAAVGGWLGGEGGEWLGGVASPYIESWTSSIIAYDLPAKMSSAWNDGIKPFFAKLVTAGSDIASWISKQGSNFSNFMNGGMDGITSGNAGANGASAAVLSEKQNKNQMMVYESFRNAGLSDGQARSMTAEVGRENSYQDKYLFGGHSDPANNEYNLGMFSWQKKRGKDLYKHLNSKGLIKNGKIVQSQEALDEQAKFAVNEMNTDPAYSRTKKEFLDNPNVSYGKANEVLGKNYIRWRYTDPKYAKHHKYRDQYKALIDKQLEPLEDTTIVDEAKTAAGNAAGKIKDAVTTPAKHKQPNSKEVNKSAASQAQNNSSVLGVQLGSMKPKAASIDKVASNFVSSQPSIFKISTGTPRGGDSSYSSIGFPRTPSFNPSPMPQIKTRLDSGSSDKPVIMQSNNDSIAQNVSDRGLAHAITGGLGQQRQWG